MRIHPWSKKTAVIAFLGMYAAGLTLANDLSETANLPLISGQAMIDELARSHRFTPATRFYAGRMGKTYDAAMAVVAQSRHYKKLSNGDRYLDPTTEVHESLHGMSALIRETRGWSIDEGYNVIYFGDGQFASIRIGGKQTKREVADWMPRKSRQNPIARTHLDDPAFRTGHVALILEELAYHLLDGKIGLEDRRYIEKKLGISNAVTAPTAVWAVIALAAATMLDRDAEAFRDPADRREFNAITRRLVEESAKIYAAGMDGQKYGLLANLTPELRRLFAEPLSEDSRQARAIRDFCAKTYGKDWLPALIGEVETAERASHESLDSAAG